MNKNKKVKMELVNTYFTVMEQKAAFLDGLYKSKYRDEALLLCCCYIEALGNNRYDSKGRHENFVKILKECGDDIFGHIHPMHLIDKFKDPQNKCLNKIGEKLETISMHPEKRLLSEEEVLKFVNPILSPEEVAKLERHLWRGTFASIAYEFIRSELVHCSGALDTSFRKDRVPGLEI